MRVSSGTGILPAIGNPDAAFNLQPNDARASPPIRVGFQRACVVRLAAECDAMNLPPMQAPHYYVEESVSLPGHRNVLCNDGGEVCFTQAYQGPDAEAQARELAEYFNEGGT